MHACDVDIASNQVYLSLYSDVCSCGEWEPTTTEHGRCRCRLQTGNTASLERAKSSRSCDAPPQLIHHICTFLRRIPVRSRTRNLPLTDTSKSCCHFSFRVLTHVDRHPLCNHSLLSPAGSGGRRQRPDSTKKCECGSVGGFHTKNYTLQY